MDPQKSSTPSEPSVLFTKPVAIYSALVIHVFECFLTWRQRRLLHGTDATPGFAAAKKALSWQTASSLWIFIATVQIVTFDGVPWLWALVGTYQTIYLPSFGSEFWRSSLFLLACCVIYMAFNGLLSVFRVRILKERFTAASHPVWRWNQPIYDITKGKPIVAVLLFFIFDVLLFKALRLEMQGNPFFVLMMVQINTVILFYPIYLQSRICRLSPLGPGELADAITESAADIKFPLKTIDVFTGPLESLDQGVQLSGWPKKTKIVIHETLLERFTTREIMGLLTSRLGDWKLRVSLISYLFSMIYFSNMFTYVLLFIKQRATYEAFGFVDEYPMIAGVVLFAVAMAKPCATMMAIQRNALSYKNTFAPDKYAADNGHLVELQTAFGKIAEAQQETGHVDWLFSLYFNGEPTISERLTRLAKIALEKVTKEDSVVEKKNNLVMA